MTQDPYPGTPGPFDRPPTPQDPPPAPQGPPPLGYGPPVYGAPIPPQPAYGWNAQYAPDPGAPWGRDPFSGQPLSDKSKLVAGLLQIFLGTFGVGRFYTGHTNTAVIMLSLGVIGILGTFVFVGVFVLIGVQIWALVDGIMLLTGRQTDSNGFLLRS